MATDSGSTTTVDTPAPATSATPAGGVGEAEERGPAEQPGPRGGDSRAAEPSADTSVPAEAGHVQGEQDDAVRAAGLEEHLGSSPTPEFQKKTETPSKRTRPRARTAPLDEPAERGLAGASSGPAGGVAGQPADTARFRPANASRRSRARSGEPRRVPSPSAAQATQVGSSRARCRRRPARPGRQTDMAEPGELRPAEVDAAQADADRAGRPIHRTPARFSRRIRLSRVGRRTRPSPVSRAMQTQLGRPTDTAQFRPDDRVGGLTRGRSTQAR